MRHRAWPVLPPSMRAGYHLLPKAGQGVMAAHRAQDDPTRLHQRPYPVAMPTSQSVHFDHGFVLAYQNLSNFGCFTAAKMRNISLAWALNFINWLEAELKASYGNSRQVISYWTVTYISLNFETMST